MSIKKLQNDFTTPEQADRLLELGVPKVTANYYYDSRDFKPQAHEVRGHWNEEDDRASRHGYKITPLWSVGRLIEIYYKVCIKPADPLQKWMNIEMGFYGLVEQMILRFVHDRDKLDFSKLEE